MAEEKKEGFKVTDTRASAQPQPPQASEPKQEEPKTVEGPGWEMHEEKAEAALPKMDFTTFCLSLASSAMMHLGLVPYPETGKAEKQLPLAKQTIDILAMLEEKTRGNLSPEEATLLGAVLYDLRMRYVELQR